jgi:hypothetical protein
MVNEHEKFHLWPYERLFYFSAWLEVDSVLIYLNRESLGNIGDVSNVGGSLYLGIHSNILQSHNVTTLDRNLHQ